VKKLKIRARVTCIHSFFRRVKKKKMRRFKLPGFICKPQPTPTEALQKKYILQQILYAGYRKKPHRWLYNWWRGEHSNLGKASIDGTSCRDLAVN
jgi:hypothetical protein